MHKGGAEGVGRRQVFADRYEGCPASEASIGSPGSQSLDIVSSKPREDEKCAYSLSKERKVWRSVYLLSEKQDTSSPHVSVGDSTNNFASHFRRREMNVQTPKIPCLLLGDLRVRDD